MAVLFTLLLTVIDWAIVSLQGDEGAPVISFGLDFIKATLAGLVLETSACEDDSPVRVAKVSSEFYSSDLPFDTLQNVLK